MSTQFLALYTGPCGPISAEFEAIDLDDAAQIVAENRASGQWYNEGSDALEVEPGSKTLQDDIEEALEDGGWVLVLAGESGDEYDIYRRKTR